MTEVKIRKGESVERALKRLGKQVDREGTLKEFRERKYYQKPSVKRKIRKQNHKFQAEVQAKRDAYNRKRV